MQETLEFDYLFKYILVGDTSVGKSTLLSMFTQSKFNGDSNPTMGVQFATKKVHCMGKVIKLQIWDTAGQQSFRTITRAYYKNAIGVILVYDITSPNTANSIDSWLAQIEQNSNQKSQIVIIGNKCDLLPKQSIPDKYNFDHFVTSAKTGLNVEKAFMYLTQKVIGKIKTGQLNADGHYGVKKGSINSTIKLSINDDYQKDSNDKNPCC